MVSGKRGPEASGKHGTIPGAEGADPSNLRSLRIEKNFHLAGQINALDTPRRMAGYWTPPRTD